MFIAVRPPGDVLELLASLDRPDEPGVRWVPAHQWHVTLRFIGDAPIEEVSEVLESAELPRARAELGPSVKRLGRGVVCVPVRGLDELASAVAGATAAFGQPPDPRPFNGHMTLARLRGRSSCALLAAPVSATWELRDVELVDSTLTGTGPIHRVLMTRRLR